MKSYVKPALEVISMRTSENIADNEGIIATIFTQAANNAGYTNTSGTTITMSEADLGLVDDAGSSI